MAETVLRADPLEKRMETVVSAGRSLESEGLPFPTEQVRSAFDEAMDRGARTEAEGILRRGEALLARVRKDWGWLRELLRRADDLRGIAANLGVDLGHLDSRVGNPRDQLAQETLSAGSLERAAASASLSLAVLNDAIPKFIVQQAEPLGRSIRRARDRGEDVREAGHAFSLVLQAVRDQDVPVAAERLVELRRSVGRIPRAPAIPTISPQQEEEEILNEARNLARRLQQIKGKARNARSAARLMAQVRAAISEDRDRRYGTPEEEVEALWAEVHRLTQEKKEATDGPPFTPTASARDEASAVSGSTIAPFGPADETSAGSEEPATLAHGHGGSGERTEPMFYRSLYVPYDPDESPEGEPTDDNPVPPPSLKDRPRSRPGP